MTFIYHDLISNDALNRFEIRAGSSARFHVYSGAPPATLSAPPTGTLIANIQLPSNWMNNAAGGEKTMAGVWQAQAIASDIAGYFRLLNSSQSTAYAQGSISLPGEGGDMEIDDTNIPAGKWVIVDAFTLATLFL